VTGHRGSSVISLIFARSGSGRICYEDERPWTSRPLKHSLAACGRSRTKLVRTRFGTTRSGTRHGLSSSLFAQSNRQRLFARRWPLSSRCPRNNRYIVVSRTAACIARIVLAAFPRSAEQSYLTLRLTGQRSRMFGRRPGRCLHGQ
jgi:hypothetical protein